MSFIEQFPIVFDALNVGFIQTLKLFIITLVGALPFGLVIAFGSMSKFKPLSAFVKTLVWVIRGTPLMLQLLVIYYFPGLVFHNNIWGSGEGAAHRTVADTAGLFMEIRPKNIDVLQLQGMELQHKTCFASFFLAKCGYLFNYIVYHTFL